MNTESELLAYLDTHGIAYRRFEHAPVYTCAQAEEVWPGLESATAAASIKNLFLAAGGRQYLVVTACERRLNLRALGQALGLRERLQFGAPEALQAALGVTPGAVTLLALVNDAGRQVQLVVDRDVWQAGAFLCHPLVNTATLVIARAGLLRFLELTGHAPLVIDF